MTTTASQYNIVEAVTNRGKNRLVVHMVETTNNRDTPIYPMDLLGSEKNLDDGRFHSYNDSLAANPVAIGIIHYADISQSFTNMVEWVAEYAGMWNFHFEHHHEMMSLSLTFYFDQPVDAMLFRLSIN